MKLTFLERLMIWLAKLSQVITVVTAKPNESHVSTVQSILDPHPIYEAAHLFSPHIQPVGKGPIE